MTTEQDRERKRRYYRAHREQEIERVRKWQREHPEPVDEAQARYRARRSDKQLMEWITERNPRASEKKLQELFEYEKRIQAEPWLLFRRDEET